MPARVLQAPGAEVKISRSVGRAAAALGSSLLLLAFALDVPDAPYDWLQNNGDPQHSGNNTRETAIGASNVASLALLFQATLPAAADGAPVALTGVSTAGGVRDLLFVTTRAGHIVALDAATGALVWSQQYGPGTCKINNGSNTCYTTSSPAIDPNRQYVYSYGLDGYVHKYQVGDGTEINGAGWPQLVTLKGFDEKGSSPLAFATAVSGATYLYMTHGGYPGDNGDYQGHVTAINLADGTQKVFNTVCSDQTVHFVHSPGTPDCAFKQTAIWARVGIVYDDVTDRIYMTTGNGTYDGSSGGHEWSETAFSLNPDGTGSNGKPLDTYTPTNFANLDSGDTDLGSTAVALLPAPGYAGRLAVQSGKDGKLRLINLQNMSGQNGPGHTGGEIPPVINVPQGGGILTSIPVWVNPGDGSTWIFVASGGGISGLKLAVTGGVPALSSQWQNTGGGFSPLVANNVLYYAGSGFLRALNPTTGALLWSDTTHVGGIHWESPVVVNGRVYLTDESAHLTAWTLPSGGTPTRTATNPPTNTATNTPTATRTNTPTSTPANTPTSTPPATPTGTATAPAPTSTSTRTNTASPTRTNTPTFTNTATPTPTPTPGSVIIPPLSSFRDVRRTADINVGPDLGGTGHTAVNFTGSAGSGGDAWITVYDTTPGTPDAGPLFGGVNLSADVLIQTHNNRKGAGPLALFNEATGKNGLGLILYDRGGSDFLTLAAVDPATGKITTISSVSLGGGVPENAWFRVTMSVVANGGNVTVTGKVFRHAAPSDPGSALGTQVGVTLNFSGARPAGVDATGEVGIVASASSTSVNSSVTNCTIGP